MAILNNGGMEGAGSPEAQQSSPVTAKIVKSNPANLVLLFLVVGMTLYGVFLAVQKGSVLANTTKLEQEIVVLQQEVNKYRDGKVEVSKNATEALAKITAEEIRWSDVIAEVNKLIPSDASGRKQIDVLSYSGSGKGRIALNAVTQPSSVALFDNVAKLIATFNNSVFFKDVYVPSISKGQNENGTSSLSFVLNMDYEKPDTGAAGLTTQPFSQENKVPRIQNK